MKEVFYISVNCVNTSGKLYSHSDSFNNIEDLSRFLITFKPKRGYEIIGFNCHKEYVLDVD